MLNWIWLGMIVIAVAVATGRDVDELATNRFRNGEAISFDVSSMSQTSPDHFTVRAAITKSALSSFYGKEECEKLTGDTETVTIAMAGALGAKTSGTFTFAADAFPLWSDMSAAQSNDHAITGTVRIDTAKRLAYFTPEAVKFRVLANVVNVGILKTADLAVTIALGLIGVMALWLGIMKIAEAAGLVALLARLAKPIMIRLFPDVPPEHPAMGAMLTNIAANMLGLSNAATPLGLKAMEELNNLNEHAGVATDAMCTFLTINTGAITLIPATVIAIRVSLGSHDPSDIIVPTLLATTIALILGVFFNNFIQRFFPIKDHD